jgi:hypothetical protein
MFLQGGERRVVQKAPEQHLDVFDLKPRPHPADEFTARAVEMAEAEGKFLNQVFQQPALEICRRLKVEFRTERAAQFGNGAELAKGVKAFRLRHPAAPAVNSSARFCASDKILSASDLAASTCCFASASVAMTF